MWQYFRKPRCRLTSSSLRSCTFDVVLSLEFTSSKFKFRIAAESVSKSLKKQRKQSTTEYSSSIIQLLWYGRRGSRKGKGSFLYTIDFYFSAPPTSFVWQRKKKNGSQYFAVFGFLFYPNCTNNIFKCAKQRKQFSNDMAYCVTLNFCILAFD